MRVINGGLGRPIEKQRFSTAGGRRIRATADLFQSLSAVSGTGLPPIGIPANLATRLSYLLAFERDEHRFAARRCCEISRPPLSPSTEAEPATIVFKLVDAEQL
jgi:hypothetical protein